MEQTLEKERMYLFAPFANIILQIRLEPKRGESNEALLCALGAAIGYVQTRHASLCSRIALLPDGSAGYEPLDAPVVRIERRESTDFAQELHRYERYAFPIERGELLLNELSPAPGGVCWTLVAHHLAGDGLSLVYFARDVLARLANPQHEIPFIPCRPLRAKDVPPDARLSLPARLLTRRFNEAWKTPRVFTWAERESLYESYWRNRETRVYTAALEGSALSNLLSACRAHDVSLTAAVAAALAQSVGRREPTGIAVSIRPEGYEGMANLAAGVNISPAPKGDFWKIAQNAQAHLRENLRVNAKKYALPNFLNAVSPTLLDAVYFSAYQNLPSPAASGLCGAMGYRTPKGSFLSNLTRAPFDARSAYFAPPLTPNVQRMIGIITCGDCLTLTMQCQSDHDAQAQQFERLLATLRALT